MGTLFQALLDEALSEIRRRDAGYLSRFPMAISSPEGHAGRVAGYSSVRRYPAGEIERALVEGAAYLSDQGVTMTEATGALDPVGAMLSDSIVDAYAADRGDLPLHPPRSDGRSFASMLADEYTAHRTADGRNYLIRRKGSRPLVLINACGIPIGVWSKFLGDPDHDFKIIVAEGPGADMQQGGIREESDLASDAATIVASLDAEGIAQTDILAWCDGGRLALDLAKRHRDRIRALVLLSVSLRNPNRADYPQTQFEANFTKVITTLDGRPNLAPFLAKMLGDQILSTDWDGVADNAAARAATLFRLPADAHAQSIRVPVSSDLFLKNHARRAIHDAAYPVEDALQGLDMPVMLVTGDHDHIVNNDLARSVLSASVPNGIHARIKGAGHYAFDLQYQYFRFALIEFLGNNRQPPITARMGVISLKAET